MALFAAAGCDLVATDQPPRRRRRRAGRLADGVGGGRRAPEPVRTCARRTTFAARVRFRPVDMNAIPADLRGFDFTWSSCALEHLGTLRRGADFVVEQMDCLRPGGVAVHTTEYLLSSNDGHVEEGGTVFYRRRDIEELAARLRRLGHEIDVDYTEGTTPDDLHVDVPPYTDVHLRTELSGYVTTSLALVVTKETRAPRRRRARCVRRRLRAGSPLRVPRAAGCRSAACGSPWSSRRG